MGSGSHNLWLGAFTGFIVIVLLGWVLPIIGYLIGGLVAGLIAKGGMSRGAQAGFLAGILGGIVVTIFVIPMLVVAVAIFRGGGLVGGMLDFVIGIGRIGRIVLGLFGAIVSAVGGLTGGATAK